MLLPDGNLIPSFEPFGGLLFDWRATRGARLDLKTTSLFLNDRWQLNPHWSFNLGVRFEKTTSETLRPERGRHRGHDRGPAPRGLLRRGGRRPVQAGRDLRPVLEQVQPRALRKQPAGRLPGPRDRALHRAARRGPGLHARLRPGELRVPRSGLPHGQRLLRPGPQVPGDAGVHGGRGHEARQGRLRPSCSTPGGTPPSSSRTSRPSTWARSSSPPSRRARTVRDLSSSTRRNSATRTSPSGGTRRSSCRWTTA